MVEIHFRDGTVRTLPGPADVRSVPNASGTVSEYVITSRDLRTVLRCPASAVLSVLSTLDNDPDGLVA